MLLIAAMFGLHGEAIGVEGYWAQFLRYLHVLAGMLWIGLLYYFNFVQIPTMPKVPAELKPASPNISRPRPCSGSAGRRWRRSCSACSSPR